MPTTTGAVITLATIELEKQRALTVILRTVRRLLRIRIRHNTHPTVPVATPEDSGLRVITLAEGTVLFRKTGIADSQAVIASTPMGFDRQGNA